MKNLIAVTTLVFLLLLAGNYFLGKDKPRIEKRDTIYVNKETETPKQKDYVIPNCIGDDGLEDLTCKKG